MSETFVGYRVHRDEGRIYGILESLSLDDLGPGEVVVRVRYSSTNFKDALAATGKAQIMRRFPLVGGIDLAGDVVSSADSRFAPGAQVLACGCGLGEAHDGGYAELARVPADWLVPMPPGLDPRSAMALGTAGLTAALAVERLEQNGQAPELGPVVVTGASGGVGSLAIDMLAARGYEVVALTGKRSEHERLKSLGAARIVDRGSMDFGAKPLLRAEWGGAVDSLGGEVLAGLIKSTRPWGNVASIGLAADSKLETTVLPFILRGVSLLGINSVEMGAERRSRIWTRLGSDLKPPHLDRIVTEELSLHELPAAFAAHVEGRKVGRSLVRIGS